MWKVLVVTLAVYEAVRTQEYPESGEGIGYPLPVTKTVISLSLDDIILPNGYEWIVTSLQEVKIPELTDEQLAELEDKMTEEHFSFIMDLMDDIRMSASSTTEKEPEDESNESIRDHNKQHHHRDWKRNKKHSKN